MKYLVNQRIKIVHEYNTTGKLGMVGYIERIDPNDNTLTYRIRLDGAGPDWEWVREEDIEPEVLNKTLTQVKAEMAALDAQEAAAHTTLKSITEHREKLRVELASYGLTPLVIALVAPLDAPTLGELYQNSRIHHGDILTFIGPVNPDREWVIGQQYRVSRVDTDDSVLLEDVKNDDSYEWAWQNEGSFTRFVKAA